MDFVACSLQSGSSGNAIYVEAAGVRLLFDAGIPGAMAERRLEAMGRDIRDVDGLFISHDHADHVLYAGVYQRKFGIPIYITPRTLKAALSSHRLGKLSDVNYFFAGGAVGLGGLSVRTIPTAHDGEDGAAFLVEAGGKRLGIMTDLGHAFAGLEGFVSTLDAVFMESNHDEEMLRHGPYPAFLKSRIAGPGGHLSNREAAGLLSACGGRLRWACLSHLSENNNRPDVALRTHREILGPGIGLFVAPRHAPTGIFSL